MRPDARWGVLLLLSTFAPHSASAQGPETLLFGELASVFTLLAMNLVDDTDAVGMIVNNGYWHPRGRNVGVSLTYGW